jgi:hypothetical protein
MREGGFGNGNYMGYRFFFQKKSVSHIISVSETTSYNHELTQFIINHSSLKKSPIFQPNNPPQPPYPNAVSKPLQMPYGRDAASTLHGLFQTQK